MIDEIEDDRIDERAIPKNQGTYTTPSRMIRKKITAIGWGFYLQCKGASGDWIAMKYLKDSYPVPSADYAMVNDIQDEPVRELDVLVVKS